MNLSIILASSPPPREHKILHCAPFALLGAMFLYTASEHLPQPQELFPLTSVSTSVETVVSSLLVSL